MVDAASIDMQMLEMVLSHLRNWFVRKSKIFYECTIENGELPVLASAYIPEGAFYRMEGSYFNEGLHIRGNDGLDDETSDIKISVLAIPDAVIRLSQDIAEWQDKHGNVADSPYNSESFGGYEYTLKGYSRYGSTSAQASGWRLTFQDRLNPWRKM